MDRQLKERIVGAAVLVALAVIFIPVILDGPDSDNRTVAMPLPPQAGDPADMETHRIDLNQAAQPVQDTPQTQADTRPQPAKPPVTTRPEPVQTRDAESAPATAPTGQAAGEKPATSPAVPGAWAVQVGSFSEEPRARKLAEDLKTRGYPAFVMRYQDGETLYFRVRVGPQQTREQAETVAKQIKQATGGPARAVPNS